MKLDEQRTRAARERHEAGVKRLHAYFRYDPNYPRPPLGQNSPNGRRAKDRS